MEPSRYRSWVRAMLLVGFGYILIGRVFALPSDHIRAWRLAAWLVSGAVYAAHIGYEHFALRHSARAVALHTALAAAIGGFGLAVAGMMHSVSATSAIRPAWLLALVLWPVITGVPAFVVALVAAAVLSRVRPLSGSIGP